MKRISLRVDHLSSCKEDGINQALRSRGIQSTTHVQDGIINIAYDPQQFYFVEIMEWIEEHGCFVEGMNTDAAFISGQGAGADQAAHT